MGAWTSSGLCCFGFSLLGSGFSQLTGELHCCARVYHGWCTVCMCRSNLRSVLICSPKDSKSNHKAIKWAFQKFPITANSNLSLRALPLLHSCCCLAAICQWYFQKRLTWQKFVRICIPTDVCLPVHKQGRRCFEDSLNEIDSVMGSVEIQLWDASGLQNSPILPKPFRHHLIDFITVLQKMKQYSLAHDPVI